MTLLSLTIVLPLIGFVILAFSRGRLSENTSAVIGVGSVGLSALAAAVVIFRFLGAHPNGGAESTILWQWMLVDNFRPSLTLYLDGLAVTMLGIITGVGFLIHLFASWYMRGEEGYSRFFAYMNLFIASMLCLVLSDNLLFLYLGWEGVGICSYLLIGFYYSGRENCEAALKSFVVTRVGDVLLIIGLFILFVQFGTLNIQDLMQVAPDKVSGTGDFWITLATLMLLGGAVGKSAQLPLQTWLPDAMAGPTPVSALIHAATMVTAGVYLIARTHGLFELAPDVLLLVGVVGALTLLLAGCAALVQTDIKRVLAYSTMSQIGYMFLALGVSAWDAAIFHLMIHAFFKALLFLASGAVIVACHHEQDMFRMGGLWKKLPLAYVSFLVGGGALSALPLVTAGFYSKDEILWEAFASGHDVLLYAGLLGALLTSIYTFRMIMLTFHGEAKTEAHAGKGISHNLPLAVLIVLSTFIGALIVPPLAHTLPESVGHGGGPGQATLEVISATIAVVGLLVAVLLYIGNRQAVTALARSALGRFLGAWWFAAWGFDWLYDKVFVRPYLWISNLIRNDLVDQSFTLVNLAAEQGNGLTRLLQTGRLRNYAFMLALGAVVLAGVVLLAL